MTRGYCRSYPKEKRAACDGKRPKSREETPKEGSDSARRYRTATICDRAAQSARPFEIFLVHRLLKTRSGPARQIRTFIYQNQLLIYGTDGRLHLCVPVAEFALEFVIGSTHWKFTHWRDLESPSEIKPWPPIGGPCRRCGIRRIALVVRF